MAGWQYNYYRANPGSFGYQAGRNNTILYNPNTACGSSTVYIANQATAGLYIYTPYQPNAAALANIGGLGNSCSSYGNINFWRLFNDWFGSTQVNVNVPYMPTQADRSVIVSLYQDFLGRAPDAGGFAYWLSAVAAGASQAALVQYTVSSREYAQLKVTQAYRSVLLRDPDPGGLTWWINTIMSGGATIDDVAYRFYLSPEFYAQGGGTDSGYVQHMYDVMLGRPAGQSEIDYWVGFIATYGRNQSTTSIWFSLEAAKARAAELYRVLLHREPDAGGLDYWAHVLIAQGAQAVRVGIAGSPEYRALAVTLYPNA
jgi:hypothetical protein